jgi:hypothetical protein
VDEHGLNDSRTGQETQFFSNTLVKITLSYKPVTSHF